MLWRHGQTDWNVENRFQGHSDIPLNKVGEYQVAQAASVLAGLKPNRIISSDLIRAQATAAALADLTNLKVEINPGLRETNGGLWEGKTAPENRATHGDLFANWYEGGDEPAGGVLAVEEVGGDAEVAFAAEDAEDLLVADVEERVVAVGLAEGDLLGEGGGEAGGEVVGDAPLLAHEIGRAHV